MLYLSGFLIGLWRPERGQFFMRSMYSPTSWAAVWGTRIIVPPCSGSGSSIVRSASNQRPPTRLRPIAGAVALIARGSTLAHDGTESIRRAGASRRARGEHGETSICPPRPHPNDKGSQGERRECPCPYPRTHTHRPPAAALSLCSPSPALSLRFTSFPLTFLLWE
eukprot:scaffold201940_cov31-Tisochrysis_lutea.AAC.2